MESRWNDVEAQKYTNDPVALRAYTSRLLGQEPALVQHGGGNTSVKTLHKNIFGEYEDILFVKGSGWDLATIQPQGFAPVRLNVLQRMAQLESLSDSDMVREQKAAMINPSAPTPSVEAILHAIIPYKFVEHTHSDAVVTMTNTPQGESNVREVFGPDVLILPYVMPGFVLARQVFERTRDVNWEQLKGIILLNHGIFTFHDEAKTSYENMIQLVTQAEVFLEKKGASTVRKSSTTTLPTPIELAGLRQKLSQALGKPMLMRLDRGEEAVGFSKWEKVSAVSAMGTVTPDHVIHIKPRPMIITKDPDADIAKYAADYHSYFEKHKMAHLKELDVCPRWAIWPHVGCLSIGTSSKALRIIDDITKHSRRCLQWAENLGGFRPVSQSDLFAVEYWELEQAKLKVIGGNTPPLQGRIAVVTGAASGIGRAIAMELKSQGACVAALDVHPEVGTLFKGEGQIGINCDVTDENAIAQSLHTVTQHFGGLDILVSNAGTFPISRYLEQMSDADWQKTIDVNLNSHWRVLKAAIPLLKLGFDPSIIMVGSKNVSAPGPGAAAYSAAKAGITQLARVAALELAAHGVRVNTIHPDAVFDTGLWNDEVLLNRAKHYGMSIEDYKRKNLLKTEITSKNVADLVCAMVGPAFSKTTGAQIPIDGGNERVI